ncbi:MAG: hypothetical protein AAFU73_18195 [Planctomycetota bacterium]
MDRMHWTTGAMLLALCAEAQPAQSSREPGRREREEAAYRVTRADLPPEVTLEVGGLALVDPPRGAREGDGPRVVAVTRRGEVWGIDGFAGLAPNATPTATLLAEGLHEPLGLLMSEDGTLVTACRSELARLVDRDGDGRYERQETVADGWRVSGNYHEYNFGPALGVDGSHWITTNKPFGDQPFGRVDWRGYALRIAPDGTWSPMCAGLRSPAGIEVAPWGEAFYTDNQGEWCGASKLSLLAPGTYHGHPHGIASTEDPRWRWSRPRELPEGWTYARVLDSERFPRFQMPTIWFPYDKMGRSPAGFVWDTTGGRFGPFPGQIFVADQYEAAVFRVSLERVGPHWQGACYRFREGLSCGAVRLAFTPSGALLVGESARGWGSRGALDEGLERIDWTGELPFEIKTMSLLEDNSGFALRFTMDVDVRSASAETSYSIQSYTYAATESYGSPELDARPHDVLGTRLHDDGRGVDLTVDGLRRGYVFELHAEGVRRGRGGPGLLHQRAFYTLGALHQRPR